MIGGMGMPELIVIFGIAVLIFGAAKIPEIAKALGKGIKEFKKAGKEITNDIEEKTSAEPFGSELRAELRSRSTKDLPG